MNNTTKTILSFAIGTGVGLATGILTAPRSGKKTREKIGDEFDKQKQALEEAATSKLNEAKDLLNSTLEKQLDKGKNSIEKVKKMVLN